MNHINDINLYNYNYTWINKLDNKPNILLMGSSTVKYGISSSILQKKLGLRNGEVINLAKNARTPIQSYFLLKDIEPELLDDVQLVIYGVDRWVFSKKYYQSNQMLIFDLNFKQLYSLIFNADNKLFLKDLLYLPIYNSMLRRNKSKKQINIPTDFGSGALLKQPKNFERPLITWFDRDIYPFSKIQFLYLNKLKKDVESKNIKFVFLYPPRRSDWRKDYYTNCDEIDIEFSKIFKNNIKSSIFIGENNNIPNAFEKEYFNDSVHLNKNGQKYYSELLGKIIKKSNVLN